MTSALRFLQKFCQFKMLKLALLVQAGDAWSSADMVDCILSYAATTIVAKLTDPTSAEEGRHMLERVKADPRAAKQLLLLSHL